MTRLDWQALAVLFGVLAAGAAALVGYDCVMYARHGVEGTISHAVRAVSRKTALFPAGVCLLAGLVVGGLVVHWWE